MFSVLEKQCARNARVLDAAPTMAGWSKGFLPRPPTNQTLQIRPDERQPTSARDWLRDESAAAIHQTKNDHQSGSQFLRPARTELPVTQGPAAPGQESNVPAAVPLWTADRRFED